MTLLSRVVWFVLGLGMVIGAMLLTVHFGHAEEDTICGGLHRSKSQCEYMAEHPVNERCETCNFQSKPFGHDGEHFTKEGEYIPPGPIPAVRAQINHCIFHGTKIGRSSSADNQNDWLLFCMQQARWTLCENCRVAFGEHKTCGEVGSDALGQNECWQRGGKPEPFNVPAKFQDRVPW
jgi:hypothetical protein